MKTLLRIIIGIILSPFFLAAMLLLFLVCSLDFVVTGGTMFKEIKEELKKTKL